MAEWGETATWEAPASSAAPAAAAPGGGEGGEDWGAETKEEVEARQEKRLFGVVRQTGIEFDIYNKIEIEVTDNDIPVPEKVETFAAMTLPEQLLSNITRMNYKAPTPVQKIAVPIAISGRDLISCAQTGSGKTGAFMFAIITRLTGLLGAERDAVLASAGETAKPMALIITPTRELAIQILTEAEKFTFKMPLTPAVAYGGQPRGVQLRKIQAGCDILIGTPGRLMDFFENLQVSLTEIKLLVLDEADRMLDKGFSDDMSMIVHDFKMPEEHQTLMFSATFEDEVKGLAEDLMKEPAFVSVGRVGSTTSLITQQLVNVDDTNKKDKLMELIMAHQQAKRILVFVEKKSTAVDLDRFLDGAGVYACCLHGDRDQVARETALNNFARGEFFLMVATDVAGRGLDIDGIDVVINFDLPRNLDSYTHRIGRTGRAGRRGLAISFINDESRGDVLEEIKLLMTETEQEAPEFLETCIAAALAARGPAGVCYAFQRGECDDEGCRFEHVEREERPQGACFAFQRGDCDDEECRFSHDPDAAGGGGGGKGECYSWKEGNCTRGDDCRFDHVGESGAGAGEKQPCHQWSRGECTRGDSCRFDHSGEGSCVAEEAGFGGGGDSGGFGGGDSGGFGGGGAEVSSGW